MPHPPIEVGGVWVWLSPFLYHLGGGRCGGGRGGGISIFVAQKNNLGAV